MTKKNSLRDQMEPVLKDIVGDLPDDPTPVAPDVIGDYLHHQQYGIDPPRDANAPATKKVVPAPLTRAQIAESLQNLSKTLGRPEFRNTAALIKALATASREHLEEGNPVRKFMEAYSNSDRGAMKAAVNEMVQASRAEILAAVKKGRNPTEAFFFPGDDETELPN